MSICRKRSTDTDLVCASLFLRNAPLIRYTLLLLQVTLNELRPKNTRINFQGLAIWIKTVNLVHSPHIHEYRAGSELLSTHGMATAGNCYCFMRPFRIPYGCL